MKVTKIKKRGLCYSIRFVLIIFINFLGINCQDEVKEWERDSNELVITEYVYSVLEQFSEFGEVLQLTGIENLLRVRGPFTLFLPTNIAMKEYYARQNVSSYTELETEELEKLVNNHILEGEVTAGSIGLGTLSFLNGLGDFIASDFLGIDILLNKSAIIIKRDIF